MQKYAETVGNFAGAYETTPRDGNACSMQAQADVIVDKLEEVVRSRKRLVDQEKEYNDAVNKASHTKPTKEQLDAQDEAEKALAQMYKDATEESKDNKEWKNPFKNTSDKPAKDAFDYAICATAARRLTPELRAEIGNLRKAGPVADIAKEMPEKRYAGLDSAFDTTKKFGIGGSGASSGKVGSIGAYAVLGAAAVGGVASLVSGLKKDKTQQNPATGQMEQKKSSMFARVTKVTLGVAALSIGIAAMYRGRGTDGLMAKLNEGVKGVPFIGR
jgi:hypothetical protein